jgi:hypothetical protein
MTTDRIIVDALKLAHSLLCLNPAHLTDTGTVLRVREVVQALIVMQSSWMSKTYLKSDHFNGWISHSKEMPRFGGA